MKHWLFSAWLAAAVLIAVGTPAYAYSCKDVHDFACSHSIEELQAMEQWLTTKQVKEARWCLKHTPRCK